MIYIRATHRSSFMQRLLHNVHSLLNTLVNGNSRRHNSNRTAAAAAKGAAAAAAAACKSICAFGGCVCVRWRQWTDDKTGAWAVDTM